MRTFEEMMNAILDVAEKDERVRAVAMGGSRMDATVARDILQDYDIVYFVKELASFIKDTQWVDRFGARMMMQTPESMALFPPELDGWYSYLMLFEDGNRLDLMLIPVEEQQEYMAEDSLAVMLLEKDGERLERSPTNEAYRAKCPSYQLYADCRNEFWWLSTYVAKGLCRGQLLYVQAHLQSMREMLVKMVEWRVGIETDFTANIGKSAKFLAQYITAEQWQALLLTYACGDSEDIWRALFVMCDLFEAEAHTVAQQLHFEENKAEAARVYAYLLHLRQLPSIVEEELN